MGALLDTAAAGGLLTVFIVTGFALGYARVLDLGPRVMAGIVALAVLSLPASQLLPEGSVFRQEVGQSLSALVWAAIVLVPFALYGFVILRLRRRTGVDDAPKMTAGVRLIDEDAALVVEGEVQRAVLRGKGAETVSLLYRGADGRAEGAVRLSVAGPLATLSGLWGDAVAPDVIAAALSEARARGATHAAIDLEPWEDTRAWAEAGFEPCSDIPGPDGPLRWTLTRALD